MNIYNKILKHEKVSELLAAIETTILLEPQNFYKFVEELTIEEESSVQHLCHKLRSTCGEM